MKRPRETDKKKQDRDWLTTAIALIGASLSLWNFWVGLNRDAKAEDEKIASILNDVARDLSDLETNKDHGWSSAKFYGIQTGLDRALASKPYSPQVHWMQAEAYWVSDRPDQAIAYCRQAIQDIPNNSLLYGELGLLYQRNGQPRESLTAYTKAIDLATDPLVVATVYRNMLLLHHNEGTTQQAIADLRARLSMPGDHRAVCQALTHAFDTYGDEFSDMSIEFRRDCPSKGKS